jgi:hypothetical protein
MAEEIKIDWDKAKNHLASVKKAAMENAGKEGHNPFIWLRDNVDKLDKQLADVPGRTPALHASILALSLTPNTATKPVPTHAYPEPVAPDAPKVVSVPAPKK